MDVAKAVSYFSVNNIEIEKCYGVNKLKKKRTPLVQIPTTAGTGSEVTPIAIFTLKNEQKMGIVDPILYADCAILDAELTLELPKNITAYSGIDAMVHAIEAYTTKLKKNPISDALAKKALNLLGSNIRTAYSPLPPEAHGRYVCDMHTYMDVDMDIGMGMYMYIDI